MVYENSGKIATISRYLREIFYGGSARILNILLPIKKKHWIFGADYGYSYRENTKYLFEYMLKNHPDYVCTFVTNSQDVFDMLKKKQLPCVMNDSLRGVWTIAEADAVFTAQNPNDINYAFKRRGRTYYYMTHGQPYKNCRETLPQAVKVKETFSMKIKNLMSYIFCVDYKMKDVSFVTATSDFLAPHMAANIGNCVPVQVLGMPRNDRFFDHERMNEERWIEGVEGKKIVTYMPTHRQYGRGELTPTPFAQNEKAQQWLRDNNVVLVMKQHPNMMTKLNNPINTDVIKDVTKMKLDPQVVLYNTDVLVSDFSSVFVDYLVLKRPLLFYIYDNYADVEGAMYDITEDFPTSFAYSEEELLELIKKSVMTPNKVVPTDAVVNKYHNHVDSHSSRRYFEAVTKEKYGK